MSIYGVHKLCRAALHDRAIRDEIKTNPAAALEKFPLTDEEKKLLLAGDVAALWERGVSGFLLSYLTRWELLGLTVEVYAERMRKAKDWRYPQGAEVTSGRKGKHEEFWR
jgi:Aromatic-ring-opening dioxygenase LigAB, LigA subunit